MLILETWLNRDVNVIIGHRIPLDLQFQRQHHFRLLWTIHLQRTFEIRKDEYDDQRQMNDDVRCIHVDCPSRWTFVPRSRVLVVFRRGGSEVGMQSLKGTIDMTVLVLLYCHLNCDRYRLLRWHAWRDL